MTEIFNARIEYAFLGFEDHNIFTCMIGLKIDGCQQGFGGYDLRNKECSLFLGRILEVVGVREWKDLQGKYCRAKRDNGLIVEIGHIIDDKWFNPKQLYK